MELDDVKKQYELILDSINEGVFVIDKNKRIVFWNEEIQRLTRWNRGDAISKIYSERVKFLKRGRGKEGSQAEYLFNQVLRSKEELKAPESLFLISRERRKIPVSFTATPVYNSKKKYIGMIVTLRDVTAECAVDEMRTEFVSLVSHQLKTPLTAISWFTEMLKGEEVGKLNERQIDYLNQIYKNNRRMVALVNDLLNITRLEAGRMTVDPRPTDIKELIEESIDEIGFFAKERNCKLKFATLEEKIDKIDIDASLVKQAVLNLLSNAIKYSKDKGGKVAVFVKKKKHDILIKVKDNGLGIPDENKNQIFQKFFRGENVITKETEGTGLGLYIVKLIIEVSGGKIWFESKEDIGTSFFFTLPLSGSKAHRGERSIAKFSDFY